MRDNNFLPIERENVPVLQVDGLISTDDFHLFEQ